MKKEAKSTIAPVRKEVLSPGITAVRKGKCVWGKLEAAAFPGAELPDLAEI